MKKQEKKKTDLFCLSLFHFFWNFFDLKSLSHILFKINEKKTHKKMTYKNIFKLLDSYTRKIYIYILILKQ